jgi:hypothetical protein
MWKTVVAIGVASVLAPLTSNAAPAAATICPPFSFVTNVNLAVNPSFEKCGPATKWQQGGPTPAPSAASDWIMHSSNNGAPVFSECVTTHAPGPNGAKMLHFIAGAQEGGIFQLLPSAPQKVMFSAWVFVKRGHVVIQPNGGTTGPAAWSSKLGEWEELRVCTDGTVATDALVIYNEDPKGGEFYVDRVEFKETP